MAQVYRAAAIKLLANLHNKITIMDFYNNICFVVGDCDQYKLVIVHNIEKSTTTYALFY